MSLRRNSLPLYALLSLILFHASPSWSTENNAENNTATTTVVTSAENGTVNSSQEWVPQPTTTFYANRGIMHTSSAEPLGAGRITFSLLGSWYNAKNGISSELPKKSNIMSGMFAFSWGVNSYVDIFAALPGYLLIPKGLDNSIEVGNFSGGIMGSLPLPESSPFKLGAKFTLFGNTSSQQITPYGADGYDFYESFDNFNFQGMIMESLVFGTESKGFKIHLNEGASKAIDDDRTNFLLGLGVQGIVHPMIVLGAEVNARTNLEDFQLKTDPAWVTLSFLLRTPHYFSATVGADIALSRERSENEYSNALEPFRLFGGVVITFDALQRKRREAAAAEQKELLEKAETEKMAQDAQRRADSLAQKAKEDSLALVQQREAEKQRADLLAKKAIEDSIALANAKRLLEEEKSKRSDAENQLLATGLLLLDAVYFESGKTEISINSKPYLNVIGKMLSKYPKLQLEVAGHTDNTGRYQTNMDLSFSRANSVKNYLIQVVPELATRLSARGYGPDMPKDSNNTANGRRNNRRVELQVTNKDILKEYK